MTLPIFPRTPEQSSFVNAVKRVTSDDARELIQNNEEFMGQLEFMLDLLTSIRPYVNGNIISFFAARDEYEFHKYNYLTHEFGFIHLSMPSKYLKIIPYDKFDLSFTEVPKAIEFHHKQSLSFGYRKFITANREFLRKVRDFLPANYRERIDSTIQSFQPVVPPPPPQQPVPLEPVLVKEGTITPERKEGETTFDVL